MNERMLITVPVIASKCRITSILCLLHQHAGITLYQVRGDGVRRAEQQGQGEQEEQHTCYLSAGNTMEYWRVVRGLLVLDL